MTIKELLPETQYDSIVFFLNENGYISPFDLSSFDYDELYFIPGVSEETVEQCKAILTENQNTRSKENYAPPCVVEKRDNNLVAAAHNRVGIKTNKDNLAEVFSNLAVSLSSAVEASENSEHFIQCQTAFAEDPAICAEYDYDLFSLLCSEIKTLITNSSGKEKAPDGYSPEERERLSSVSVKEVFSGIPRRGAMTRYCAEKGISTLLDLNSVDFAKARIKGLGSESIKLFEKAFLAKRTAVLAGEMSIPDLEQTPLQWFVEVLSGIKDRDKDCIIAKAQGQTLQEIGDKYDLTRERVRQVINKVIRRLSTPCEAVLQQLMAGKTSISALDIKTFFSEQSQVDVIIYVLGNIRSVRYFPFADKYVLAKAVPDDCYERLRMIAQDIIGDSVNYYDNLELIDERLLADGISFIDSIDYMGYLLENGYKALGDYVVKKSQAYRNICLNVIRRHFPDGIKLDNDENNADMARLRVIVRKEFGEAGLPTSNRPLTARISPALILCGRGRYISPENADIDLPLIEQIVDYINSSDDTSFYYSDIFSMFSGRLLAQTGIDNYNYLHGVLKTLYPDEFVYERDLLVKKGMDRIPFEERLAQLLKSNHRAMSRAEIRSRMTGVSDIRIVNALVRLPDIIQWDYNEFNHTANLHVTSENIELLDSILLEITDGQFGYCSENQLFAAVTKKMPQFIQENQIKNGHNLFYVSSALLGDKFRFSRPHIASGKFPNVELTNANIVRFFIGQSNTLTYPDLVELSKNIGWANGTFTIVLNTVEKDYCRISLDDYILKNDFHISADAQNRIKSVLADLIAVSGYYGIFAIYNYDPFPPIEFEWNEFLLQTIMEKYDLGYKLLEPNTKDRRYKRGIIVPNTCKCCTFEEFVIEQLKEDHIHSIPEDEFSSYLRRKGLVLTTNIPQELYDGDGVRLENGAFVYE